MQNERRPESSAAPTAIPPESTLPPVARPATFTLRSVLLYQSCDRLSQWLIYFSVVFSPWAFGTTQAWSVATMNLTAYLLGVLLLVKYFIRRVQGYQPPRWTPHPVQSPERARNLHRLTGLLFGVTVLLLGYCLVAMLNARSTWQPAKQSFAYHEFFRWLPHSYDRTSSEPVFWNYLALACAFWAVHDWLLGKTAGEDRAQRRTDPARGESRLELLPARLRGLLWVLCLNGALLGAEGIAQRLSGSGKLLWLIEPRVNKDGLSQFGPYAYRSNAAQYFNLLWPVCLGFWWTLHRTGGFKRWMHHLLLPAGAIMAACPIIATTRGGAMVAGGLIFLAASFLLLAPIYLPARPRHSALTAALTFGVLGIFFVTALTLGYQLGWDALGGRMTELESGYELREAMYVTARTMAQEHPWWGTGPGTFNQMFQFYRSSPDEYWPAQLHNDWLETRITFGGVGSALIATALLLVLARWFLAGGIHGGRRFIGLVWLALAGALLHARFDFPFQIYSIVLLFLVLCAVLFSLSRRGGD